MKLFNRIFLMALIAIIFTFSSKADVKSKFDITFSGFLKFDMFHDNTEVSQGDCMYYVNPGGTKESKQNIFSATVRRTRFAVTVDGPKVGETGRTKAYIETDFGGGYPNSSTAATQPNLRIRHAWAEYSDSWFEARFGQDWSLISPLTPNSVTLSSLGAFGNLWIRVPQARFTVKYDELRLQASINRPVSGNTKYDSYTNGDADPISDGERSGQAWYMGRLALENKNYKISASGHWGQTQIPDIKGRDHINPTFSYNADILLKSYGFTFSAKAFMGENLKSFHGGIDQGVVKSTDTNSHTVTNVKSSGGWTSLQYQATDFLAGTVGFGMDDPDDKTIIKGMRAKNTLIWANVEFNIEKALIFMLEVQSAKTDYIQKPTGDNLRIHFTTYFKF